MAKMVDRVMNTMQKEAQIRNIAIAAHIDHGKCVKAETRIQITDGSFVTAEELFENVAKDGTLVKQDNDIVYVPKKDINVFSLNKEHGVLEHKKIEHAWKLNGGKLIKVKLRNGAEVSTTPEHRYIVMEDMEFVEKEADELKLGDRIVCARDLIVEEKKEDIKSEMLKKLAENSFYVKVNEFFGDEIKGKVLRDGLDTIDTAIKKKSFYHGMWQYRYRLADIVQLCKQYDIDLLELYENIVSLYYMLPGGKSSVKIKLPSYIEDLFYLAGLLVGDGSGNKFVVGKEELGKEFRRICADLDFTPAERNYEGKTPELCTNRTVFEMLRTLFDYPVKRKSHNVKISKFLSTAPQQCVAHFLQAYFDCDGTVEKSRSAISLTSVSKQMLKDLQLLLLRFGIVSILQKNSIYVSGNSAKTFEEKIGFTVSDKIERTKTLTNKSTGSYVLDTIPVSHEKMAGFRKVPKAQVGHHYYKYEKQLLTPTIDTFNKVKQNVASAQGQVLELERLSKGDLAYIEVIALEEDYADTVYDFTVAENHNFVAEGMVIHNTTFSDNLLAGAGMMSQDLAGSARVLDFHDDEAERGITIDSAAVSMVHAYDGSDYLINLIDTPGHVDFGGDVTRAMRAVDGCIVLVCAVEGMMPQTETVLRQALRERVKPILFINKVDRLIKELKLTPEQMQERFIKIINEVNQKIRGIAEDAFKDKFVVNVNDGSVCMGSAFHNWALNVPFMQKSGISFKDIISAYETEDGSKALREKCALHDVILNAVITHHPSPKTAAEYRIPKIWHGDVESPLGKSLVNCDPSGSLGFVVTKVVVDPQAGEIAAGRLFSGTMTRGVEGYMNRAKQHQRIQQVYIYNGAKKEIVDNVPAGNIIGVGGLKNAYPGETVTMDEDTPFEQITHLFDPVITKAIEAKKPSDLPKLIEVLVQVGKEDPSIKVEINQETGEHLISGMGELHLEIIENRVKTEKGVEIETSPPVVVYRETITKQSGAPVEGKTPNKHNKLYFTAEPVSAEMMQAMKENKVPEGRVKKKDSALWTALQEAGMETKESRNVRDIFNHCILVDDTKGEVHIGEIIEMVTDMFEDVMSKGPLANEPCFGVLVRLVDVKLHEDAIHRGPAQMYPAVREGIRGAMAQATPLMYEPIQTLRFEAPQEYMGEISKLISNKRGQLLDMQQEGEVVVVLGKLPVGEMFGLSSDLRSATGGRGSSSLIDQTFEKLPHELQAKIMNQIRERKGLKVE